MFHKPSQPKQRRGLAIGVGAACALAIGVAAAVPASAIVGHGRGDALPTDSMWAVVNGQNGGVANSDGHVVTSEKLADTLDGQGYRVTFDRRVRECSYTATIAAAFLGDIANASKGISVLPSSSSPNAVLIKTKDNDDFGSVINQASFSLQVECA